MLTPQAKGHGYVELATAMRWVDVTVGDMETKLCCQMRAETVHGNCQLKSCEHHIRGMLTDEPFINSAAR